MAHTVGGTRHKLSMIATVTNQGRARWMIIDEAFDAGKLIEFLAALIKEADKKVFLILDNLRVHHSKVVKAWVGERREQIEVFYLPSYSPQLNPEERLNADLKQEIGKRVPVRTKAGLRERRPTSTWPCWSAPRSALSAIFRTAGCAMRLNTSSGRINSWHRALRGPLPGG
ncbi:hypothetical protein BH10PSE16_BH10PSE16_33980 [soil metagenome]